MTNTPSKITTLTYLLDPLCGWCYAVSPALEFLQKIEGIKINIAPTGLFTGSGARKMDAEFGAYAWSNDERIEKLTGQHFSQAYRDEILGKPGQFDSGPLNTALTAVALTQPAAELSTLHSLQHARYVLGLDTSDLHVVVQVLEGLGQNEAAELLQNSDAELLTSTKRRVDLSQQIAQQLGVRGVPKVAVHRGHGLDLHVLNTEWLLGPREALVSAVFTDIGTESV